MIEMETRNVEVEGEGGSEFDDASEATRSPC